MPAPAPVTAISFDAGFTLVEPRVSIDATYLGVARDLGVEIDAEPFGAHLRASWNRIDTDFRSRHPSLRTSEEMEKAAWFAFTRAVASPFPGLLSQHETWHSRLVHHFDSAEAWHPIEGVVETLEELGERDIQMAVTSNWHLALHRILEDLGLRPYFASVLTSAEVGRKKPHAQIFRELRRALKAAGCPEGRTLHVGDSWHDDVDGARRAGLEGVWYAPRGDQAPYARATVIRHPREVLGLID
jgi:putative hydrolase of the HAD superfamily